MTVGAPPDLLETIVAATRCTVQSRRDRDPLASLARRVEQAPRARTGFREALARTDRINVIAECKRRSPSKGVLRRDYDPAALASGYVEAGAAAISVLTEPSFFDGSLDHLMSVRARVEVPLLRKDFIVDEYQLFEARAAGADAVLLIVAAVSPADLRTLHARGAALGLDALVEVHSREELTRAVDAGARIVGVNNRNLRTLEVDVGISEELASMLPPGVMGVAESGLKNRDEIDRLRALGYRAFLIGERFMVAENPAAALREVLM